MTEATLEITRQKPLWATGRRKSAVARVRVVPGEGRIVLNGKTLEDFFGGNERQKAAALAPFHLAKTLEKFDLFISTSGGGITGQAESIRLGIARAMVDMDPTLRTALRAKGFLTRDPREVERKKSGQPKARKRYQHSKR
ncbi:MAG: 30S ribosomal protein S9 [Elusimicrobia bacterium]|jgi:small subunit ribosomal protein S9|nr:30S ribosomal protein S9 [Elusimicrobiota bacterium]